MNILAAIIILSLVIFIHELGHFLLAKAGHITVLEFSFGMGPRLLKHQHGETLYSLKLLPFGGSCAMKGEDEDDTSEGSFQAASVWRRIAVVAAGPIFNFLLALAGAFVVITAMGADPATVAEVEEGSPAEEAGLEAGDLITVYQGEHIVNGRELYSELNFDGVPSQITMTVSRDGQSRELSFDAEQYEKYLLGFDYMSTDSNMEISSVVTDSPMEAAGAQAGDVILAVNGTDIESPEDWTAYFEEHPMDGSPVEVTLLRGQEEYTVDVTPELSSGYLLGFSFNLAREHTGFLSSIGYSFGELKYWVRVTIRSLFSLFSGRYSLQDMSGPVGVVSTIGQVYNSTKSEGTLVLLMTMINMLILISVNLGVINLLPLPALDGGRLVFLFIEAIRRKPINQEFEGRVHFIGIMALMALMVLICYNDIIKLIP